MMKEHGNKNGHWTSKLVGYHILTNESRYIKHMCVYVYAFTHIYLYIYIYLLDDIYSVIFDRFPLIDMMNTNNDVFLVSFV